MTMLTLTEAADAAGVARSTLYRAIEDGRLSRTSEKTIDAAELQRVFGELRAPVEEGAATDTGDAIEAPAEPADAAWLRQLVDTQNATIARLHDQLEAAATEQRDTETRWHRQVAQLTALLPAPAQTDPVSKPRGGFLRRVFG